MSKNPTKTNTNETMNKNEVKEVVAETVAELRTTTQEKPDVKEGGEEAKLPNYDAEAIKTMNVSQAIRYLHNQGFTRGQIVKEFPKAKGRTILYQHVRNVLITPVKIQS